MRHIGATLRAIVPLIFFLLAACFTIPGHSSRADSRATVDEYHTTLTVQPSVAEAEYWLERFNYASAAPDIERLYDLTRPRNRDESTGLWYTGPHNEVSHDDAAQARALNALLYYLGTHNAPTNLFHEDIDPAGKALLNSIAAPKQAERGMQPYAPAYTDIGGIPFMVAGATRKWEQTYQAQDNTLLEVVEALLRYRSVCQSLKPGRVNAIDRTLVSLGESITVVIQNNGALPGNWHYDATPAWARAWEPPVQMETFSTAHAVLVLERLLHTYENILPPDSVHPPRWRAAQAYCLDALQNSRQPGNKWARFNQSYELPDGGYIWKPVYGTPEGTILHYYDENRVQDGYLWIIDDQHNANRVILDALDLANTAH